MDKHETRTLLGKMTAQQERHYRTVAIRMELQNVLWRCGSYVGDVVKKYIQERIAQLDEQIAAEEAEAIESYNVKPTGK